MFLKDASAKAAAAAVTEMGTTSDEIALILIAGPEAAELAPFVNELRKTGVPFVGAVVPGLIEGHQLHRSGVILRRLPCVEKPLVVTGLHHNHVDFPPLAIHIAESGITTGTALVLVDGLTRNICGFLAELSGVLGNVVRYIGGGAGYPDFRQRPCLFTADGPLQDTAITIVVPSDSTLGVRHGYERLVGPVVATKTRNNVICELNWRNAYEVYREVLQQECREAFVSKNTSGVLQRYPFGIIKEGEEDVLREAVSVTSSGELLCIGDIAENTVLNILRGREDRLIAASQAAARECVRHKPSERASCLVVDCVSRSVFLGSRYGEELSGIEDILHEAQKTLCLEGFLSVGEIASYGEGTVDYLNKTTVIGAFHE